MKTVVLIGLLSLPVGACGTQFDLAKMVPVSGQTLTSGFASQEARERTLIAELQEEDESLRFLSKGKYSCGDPRLLAKLLDRDPAKIVADVKVSKKFDRARNFVDGYLKALDAIVAQNKSDIEAVDAASGIATAVNSFNPTPAAPAVKTAIAAFQVLIREGLTSANVWQMKYVAEQMHEDLKRAVGVLKINYPAFAATETGFFRKWNECALEKLVYIRDQPNGQVPGYEKYSYIFDKNGGLELDAAYSAYLTKRRTLQAAPLKMEVFESVVTENEKLKNGDFSLQSVNATLQQLVLLKKDFDAVVTATEPLLVSLR